jgi:hypothetical protein
MFLAVLFATAMPATSLQGTVVDVMPVDAKEIVSAAADCLEAHAAGNANQPYLVERGWTQKSATLNDGPPITAYIREDGTIMFYSSDGCVVRNPLPEGVAYGLLAAEISNKFAVHPITVGRDKRWITPTGLVQMHFDESNYANLIVQKIEK